MQASHLLAYFSQSLENQKEVFLNNLPMLIKFIGLFWLIQVINVLCGGRLRILGIYPRHPYGLVGIICSPFLHRDWNHLIVNTLMLIVLTSLVLVGGAATFWSVTGIIVVVSGLAIWFAAREGLHIGASSLVMGYWGYLLIQVYHHPNALTILIAAVCLYFFSGMFVNLLPGDKKVSWEGHVFGFISGILACYMYPWVVSYFNMAT